MRGTVVYDKFPVSLHQEYKVFVLRFRGGPSSSRCAEALPISNGHQYRINVWRLRWPPFLPSFLSFFLLFFYPCRYSYPVMRCTRNAMIMSIVGPRVSKIAPRTTWLPWHDMVPLTFHSRSTKWGLHVPRFWPRTKWGVRKGIWLNHETLGTIFKAETDVGPVDGVNECMGLNNRHS